MVVTGDVLQNPLTGETFTVLKSAAETKGRLFQMESRVAIGAGARIPPHYHPAHLMKLTIQQGVMRLWMGEAGRWDLFEAGDQIIVPANVPYNWNIHSDQELRFISEFQPAGHWGELFESMCTIGRLAAEKKLNLAVAAMCVLDNFQDHMYLQPVPEFARKLLFNSVARLAHSFGYRGYYPYRLSLEQPPAEF